MGNILTDTSASFGGQDVFGLAKVNNTPRLPSAASEYVIAQWANEIDDGLIDINLWLQGGAAAGSSGATITYLGAMKTNGKFAASGANISDISLGSGGAVGSVSDAATGWHIMSSSAGAGAVFWGDESAPNSGALVYLHSTNSFNVMCDGADVLSIASGSMYPKVNTAVDLGFADLRWKKLWLDQLDVLSSARFGTGGTAINVTLDGGLLAGQEPRIRFANAGVVQAQIELGPDGSLNVTSPGPLDIATQDAVILPRFTTAERLALDPLAAKLVYDTALSSIFYHNGAQWFSVEGSEMGSVFIRPEDLSGTASITQLGGAHSVRSFSPVNQTTTAFSYFRMPKEYLGGDLQLDMYWSGAASSVTNVAWGLEFSVIRAGYLLTGAPSTSDDWNLLGPAVLNSLLVSTRTLTNALLDFAVAEDILAFRVTRYGGQDAYAGAAYLAGLKFSQV